MGSYGMDPVNTQLALFEMRGYRAVFSKKTKDEWIAFAKERYMLAAAKMGL